MKPKTIIFGAIFAFFVLLALTAITGSFFVVKPSELAYVRQLGTVTTKEPFSAGFHMKAPWISTVDKCQVSLTNVQVPKFTVSTIDNQIVTLEINISYTTPTAAVYHLLYQVGGTGSGDIHDNVLPIVKDRVSRIFASQNTNSINEKREALQQEIQESVATHLKELFWVDVQALQISQIQFSDAFNQSNAQAVLSKNAAVKEQNELKVKDYQAQQQVVTAKGEAAVRAAKAEGEAKAAVLAAEAESKRLELVAQGQAKATILAAEADKQKRELAGKGEGLGYEYIIKAVGGARQYADILNAKAQTQWR